MAYIGLVCARSGSKGLPGKNTRQIMGVSLVAHAVKKAKAVSRISTVLLSSDSDEIARLARAEGAEVPFSRPQELSGDNSSEWEVWRHMLKYLKENAIECSALVVVPPTAPLRSVEDINACIDLFETGSFDIVITVTDASRSPYFNMVRSRGNNVAELVIKPEKSVVRRQDAPQVYDMTTVAYVARPDFVLSADNLFDGHVGYVNVPSERAIDIDTQLDFDFAQFLAIKNFQSL